jgi:site-specific DNA-methyltransferase (adenine-specific)
MKDDDTPDDCWKPVITKLPDEEDDDDEMSFELHHGDCLEVMRTMADKSVDCVITDPPYGVELEYSSYEDTFENWKDLISRFIPEAIRVSRGSVIVPTSMFEAEQYLHSLNPIWRICWFKGASCTRSPIGLKDWEPTFVFGAKPKRQIHDYFTAHANQVRSDFPEHPCPKPLAWAMWLVRKLTDEGETVFDPFMGSGTTGVAAMKLGCEFIGVEKDGGYFNLAKSRIHDASCQSSLFMEAAV